LLRKIVDSDAGFNYKGLVLSVLPPEIKKWADLGFQVFDL
jgi:hypothetical protein